MHTWTRKRTPLLLLTAAFLFTAHPYRALGDKALVGIGAAAGQDAWIPQGEGQNPSADMQASPGSRNGGQVSSIVDGQTYPESQGEESNDRISSVVDGQTYPEPQGEESNGRISSVVDGQTYPEPQGEESDDRISSVVNGQTYPESQRDGGNGRASSIVDGQTYPESQGEVSDDRISSVVDGQTYPESQGEESDDRISSIVDGQTYPESQGDGGDGRASSIVDGQTYPESQGEEGGGQTSSEGGQAVSGAQSDSQTSSADGEDASSESGRETAEDETAGAESSEGAADETLDALLEQIRAALPSGNGNWAVYVIDLAGGSEAGINDSQMQAASLIKLYIMGAVYENYDSLIGQYGQDSIDAWLRPMITVSDNDAANSLVNCLGGGDSSAGMAVVNDYCQAHGYSQSSMGRLLLQSNEFGDNYTSVSDCAHFLQAVYTGNSEDEESPHADDMYSLLKDQERRNKIPAQMPPGVRVANKTGELDDVENDAGILYDTGNDLILVFMSEDLSDVGSAQSTIASLSRQIYDYYN